MRSVSLQYLHRTSGFSPEISCLNKQIPLKFWRFFRFLFFISCPLLNHLSKCFFLSFLDLPYVWKGSETRGNKAVPGGSRNTSVGKLLLTGETCRWPLWHHKELTQMKYSTLAKGFHSFLESFRTEAMYSFVNIYFYVKLFTETGSRPCCRGVCVVWPLWGT